MVNEEGLEFPYQEPFFTGRLEVQEYGSVTAVLQDSLDERYLVPSSCSHLSEFHQPSNGPVSLSEEHLECSAMNPSENKIGCKAGEGQEAKASRKYYALIHDQARELTQLRQQLREGRDTSFSLSQHLKDLLTQKDPDFYQTQGFREQLDEGRSLVEHLVCKLSSENHKNEEEEKEKEPLSKMNDQDREFNFLIQVQARDLTQLRQKLQEGREAASFLSQHVNELFTQDDFDSQEGQNPREQLAEGCRLAQCLAHRLCPENLEDEDDNDEEQVPSELDPRNDDVLAEVQVGEVTQLLQQLQEKRETYFFLNQHLKDLFIQKIPDNHQSQNHGKQLTEGSRLVEPFIYKKSAENHNDEVDDEEVSLVSSRHTSHLQEDKVKELFTDSLGKQYFHPFTHTHLLDSQELLRGSALPLDGPKVSPALNQDKVNSDASFQMRKPATKEGDTPEGSLENTRGIQDGFIEAASVLKEKNFKGKSLLSKWRIACRFPGPGYKELNSGACFEMKLEGDAPKGSIDHTPGFQHGFIDATNVLKWKILKRKLLFSRCRIVCRFPELEQTGFPVQQPM
ncbi:NBPF family member NBPF8-like [Castor canadensis]|uniref:NBPF family member NBPF8-like n=1 Tax=Castor canadensis TaxID=51338 RepID=A0AC58MFR8_CASCN